jgi:hypothetical protein
VLYPLNVFLPVESISGYLENQLNIYLKLFIILYADDTVILSESESDLQAQLDAFHEYCLTWKLKVNNTSLFPNPHISQP